jgi:hypothetical protein
MNDLQFEVNLAWDDVGNWLLIPNGMDKLLNTCHNILYPLQVLVPNTNCPLNHLHKRREARHQAKQLVSPSSLKNLVSHPYVFENKKINRTFWWINSYKQHGIK